MCRLFSLKEGASVLDPCFGKGIFIESLSELGRYNISGIEIDEASFRQFEAKNPSARVQRGNFFDIPEGTRYDGIILNPPYIRQELIDSLSGYGMTKARLQQLCAPFRIPSKANLYIYFIAFSLKLLSDGGELVVIVPDTWMKTPNGKEFLHSLEESCCIAEHIPCKGNPFDGAPIVSAAILKFIKGGKKPMQADAFTGGTSLVALSSIASIRRGITTGFNKVFINPPLTGGTHISSILSSPRAVPAYTSSEAELDRCLMIPAKAALDSETSDYLDGWAGRILKEGKPSVLAKAIKEGKEWYKVPVQKPADIVFPYIVRNRLRFILNDAKVLCRDNFYSICCKDTHPLLLFALLNNYHIYCQLEDCGKNYGNGVLKIQKYDVDALMVVAPDKLSGEDAAALKKSAKKLAESGNERQLEKISGILDKYYGNAGSKTNYISKRNERLCTE